MKRTLIALVPAMLGSLIAGPVLAGGLAHVRIVSAPKEVVAGKSFQLDFAVQPQWPMAKNRSLEPTVRAVCGDHRITAAAVPTNTAGRYRVTLAVPAAGEWIITVDSRFCETRMKPLVLKAAESRATES